MGEWVGREKGKEEKDEVNRHDVVRFALARRSRPPLRCVGVALPWVLSCGPTGAQMQMRSMLAKRHVQAERVCKNGKRTLQNVCCGSPASSAGGGPEGPGKCAHLRFCGCPAATGFAEAAGVHRARWGRDSVTQPVCVQACAAPPRVLLTSPSPVLCLTRPLDPKPLSRAQQNGIGSPTLSLNPKPSH